MANSPELRSGLQFWFRIVCCNGPEPPRIRFLDTPQTASYNPAGAEIAQLVEHATENRGVASSILALGTLI